MSTLIQKAMLVLPAFPVSASFSEMGSNEENLMKDTLRYLLHNGTLNSLLMIHVSGPPPKLFQPKHAVNDW
jgi:hypothetical protein